MKGGILVIDPQLKRGLLDACVLALLRRSDSYGYQIIKDLSQYVDISESTLYPILRRLESSGALTVYSVEHNGRLRKFYRITEQGIRQTDEFLASWTEIERIYHLVKECSNYDES